MQTVWDVEDAIPYRNKHIGAGCRGRHPLQKQTYWCGTSRTPSPTEKTYWCGTSRTPSPTEKTYWCGTSRTPSHTEKTYWCGTSRTPSPTGVRDVEDAIPYILLREDAVPYRKNQLSMIKVYRFRIVLPSRTPSPTGKAARNADTT